MNVLVTGANGFIGRQVSAFLLARGHGVSAGGRAMDAALAAAGARWVPLPDLRADRVWDRALDGVDAVVHLAGMAHRQDRMAQRDWDGFDRVNHRATRSLAEEIRRHPSIKRFIYISSVAVHGTRPTVPLTESSPPAPDTPYGQSKWNAEQAIQGILDPVQFPWVILRSVLVYGPGNPGNMARLAGMLNRGWPVPVTRVPNRRSFLYIGNLTDAIGRCLESCPAPAGRTWLVADRETPSTAALVQALGRAAGRPPRTLALPPGLWKASARLGDLLSRAGLPCPWNEEVRGKLLDDFQVDATAIRNDLPWDPPYSFLQGIGLTFAGQANGTGCG